MASEAGAAPPVPVTVAMTVAAVRIQAVMRGSLARRRADGLRRLRRGVFRGRAAQLSKLLQRRRLKFARDGASARIAHAWRVHRVRVTCKRGLSDT